MKEKRERVFIGLSKRIQQQKVSDYRSFSTGKNQGESIFLMILLTVLSYIHWKAERILILMIKVLQLRLT